MVLSVTCTIDWHWFWGWLWGARRTSSSNLQSLVVCLWLSTKNIKLRRNYFEEWNNDLYSYLTKKHTSSMTALTKLKSKGNKNWSVSSINEAIWSYWAIVQTTLDIMVCARVESNEVVKSHYNATTQEHITDVRLQNLMRVCLHCINQWFQNGDWATLKNRVGQGHHYLSEESHRWLCLWVVSRQNFPAGCLELVSEAPTSIMGGFPISSTITRQKIGTRATHGQLWLRRVADSTCIIYEFCLLYIQVVW